MSFSDTSSNEDEVSICEFLIKRPFIQVPTCLICGLVFHCPESHEHDLPGNENTDQGLEHHSGEKVN